MRLAARINTIRISFHDNFLLRSIVYTVRMCICMHKHLCLHTDVLIWSMAYRGRKKCTFPPPAHSSSPDLTCVQGTAMEPWAAVASLSILSAIPLAHRYCQLFPQATNNVFPQISDIESLCISSDLKYCQLSPLIKDIISIPSDSRCCQLFRQILSAIVFPQLTDIASYCVGSRRCWSQE